MTPKPRNSFAAQAGVRVTLLVFVFLFSRVTASAEIPAVKEGVGAPNSQQGDLPRLPEAALPMDAISVSDASGASRSLAEYAGQSATVIVFLYEDCPMCKKFAPILEDIWQSERGRGAQMLGVFIDGTSSTELEKFQKEYGLTFPLLVDTGGKLASALSATVVPEAFVLDQGNKVRYLGRINDSYQVRGESSQTPVREDLKEALSDVLAGSKVRLPRTLAVGCALGLVGNKKNVPPQPAPAVERTVTYHQDVAPILRKHCMSCHSAGNAGPFSLTSYDDAVDMLQMGLQEIKAQRMPPAQAESDLEIIRPNTMAPEEVETLRAWVKGGEEEGDPATAAPLAPLHDQKNFQAELGPPDIIIEQSEPFHLGPVGSDVYRHQVFPINSDKDLRVRAVQMLPSDRSIVHHALIGYMPHSEAQNALREHGGPGPTYAEGDSGPGFWAHHGIGFRLLPPRADGLARFSFLSAYVPGTEAYVAPDDADYIIPAGSDIVVQMHYHRNGKQSQDSTRMGLWLRKEGEVSPKVASMLFVHGDLVVVPAGIKNMRVSGHWTVPEDCTIAGIGPHAHLLARSLEVTADIPGRGSVLLVKVPRWNYDWQQPYFFKEPFFLPKGTTLTGTGIFDNSEDNPRNPFSPPQPVFLGEATTDEMLLPMLVLTSEKQIDPHGGSFTRFGASVARANFLRDIYNDRLSFEVQPDGTLLRVAYTTTDGVLHRLKKPVDPTTSPTEYEKD
jgi:peroxiredoxin